MKIENLEVQEMSQSEMKEVVGGYGSWLYELGKSLLTGELIRSGIQAIKDLSNDIANSDYEMPEWQKHKMGGL